MDDSDYLFRTNNFYDAVRIAPENIKKAVDELDDEQLFREDRAALVEELVKSHLIAVPVLDVKATKASESEVDIDISGDPRQRFMRDLDGPFYVKATAVTFRVPYQGDQEVFEYRPSSYTLSPPRAEVESDALVIRVVRQDQNAAEYRKEFDRTLAQIEASLTQLRSDCAGLEQTLRQTAEAHLTKRREKRKSDRGLISQLGFGESKE